MELPNPVDPDTVDQRVILYDLPRAQFLALADSRGTSSNQTLALRALRSALARARGH